ncbi:MAG: amino acid ABC transporter permease [bacterium]|jgi:His/Glu/Gln/Arg/opine family amino acid ABC transporter permease subunit|nr:amino acid ABC transporter permease [bacterium]
MNFSFLLDPYYQSLLLQGLFVTLVLALLAVFIGTLLALGLAIVRMSSFKPLKFIVVAYVEIIRGTPIVVQLIIMYSLLRLPVMLINNFDISPFIPGMFTLFINSSAYMSEVVRAGVASVDKGQSEAGRSLGLTQGQTFRKIILPQAIKNILPALGNEFVTLIKETSVLMYSGVAELTYQASMIKSETYSFMESYLVAAVLYFALTFPTSKLMAYLERRMKKADAK